MENKELLYDIFKNDQLSEEEIKQVLEAFEPISFSKNDFLLEENQIVGKYYFVQSGVARSFVIDTEGNDITTAFFSKSDVIMEAASFFLKVPTRQNIQAINDMECWQTSYAKFETLFHSIERFREGGRSRLVANYFALMQKNISMIADPAKVRYQQMLETRGEILQQVSLKHIASYLGITDTSLSRIRKEIKNDK